MPKGLSLVELLIAMALGTFLSVITLQTYLSSGHTEVIIRNSSSIQENVRFALKIMSDSIQKAGYREVTDDRDVFSLNSGFEFAVTGDALTVVFTGSSQIIWGLEGGDGASDELFIRYKVFGGAGDGLDSPLVDCHGQQFNFDPLFESVGFVQLRYFLGDDGLSCVANRIYSTGSFGSDGSSEPIETNQPIVEGVTGMQLLFGYDADGDGSADDYLMASDALLNGDVGRTVGGAWNNIVSVDIRLSLEDSSPMYGAEVIDREFSQVVALRNL